MVEKLTRDEMVFIHKQLSLRSLQVEERLQSGKSYGGGKLHAHQKENLLRLSDELNRVICKLVDLTQHTGG